MQTICFLSLSRALCTATARRGTRAVTGACGKEQRGWRESRIREKVKQTWNRELRTLSIGSNTVVTWKDGQKEQSKGCMTQSEWWNWKTDKSVGENRHMLILVPQRLCFTAQWLQTSLRWCRWGFRGKCTWSKNSRWVEWMHYSVERVVYTLSDQSTHRKGLWCLKTFKPLHKVTSIVTRLDFLFSNIWAGASSLALCNTTAYVHHQIIKRLSPHRGRNIVGEKYTHRLRNVSWSDTIKLWLSSRLHLKNRYSIPKPSSCAFNFVVPLEHKWWLWEGNGSTHSGPGQDPAGKNSQSWHKDKVPSCAGMTL